LENYMSDTYKYIRRRLPAGLSDQFGFAPPLMPAPAYAGGQSLQPIQVNIDVHDISVRDDKDIDRIIHEVERAINKKLVSSNRYRGLTS
jgi:hypothetical protein